MKKALVLAIVCALGLGAAAFAGPLTGSWSTFILFTPISPLTVGAFESVLQVDYTVSGWTFGSNAIFTATAFDNLYFEAAGALGAFTFKSMLDFEPAIPAFVDWVNAGSVNIAGVTFYSVFEIHNFAPQTPPTIGVGALLGAFGSAGDLDVYVQAQFNETDNSYSWWYYGYDTSLSYMAYKSCTGVWSKPSTSFFNVVQSNCTMAFSGVDIYVSTMFTCIDVMAHLSFSCTAGFDGLSLELTNINIGIPWLSLSEVDIEFAPTSKSLFLYWDVTLGNLACIKPYIELLGPTDGGPTITGITLNALLLEFKFNGVTFKAGEIFEPTWRGGHLNYARTYGFTPTGGLSYYAVPCVINFDYDEYLGIVVTSDACCGGAFQASVFNWFNAGASSGIFDWQETTVSVTVGFGSNVTFTSGMSMKQTGLNSLSLGITFTW